MRAKFVGALSGLQCLLLLIQGVCYLNGRPLHWAIVLIPLWALLFVAVVFWLVFGLLWSKFGK